MKILVIDNYDSFTYNLVQYIREIVPYPVDVFRNDAIPLNEVELYDIIVLSPGPGVPSESGITPKVIEEYHRTKSILGVCLGHQAIGEVFGGQLHNLDQVFHGVATEITVTEEDILFEGIPNPFPAGRYHSWIVQKDGLPECLEITAEDHTKTIMALRHKEFNVRGVQFHPESILTPDGKKILKNFFDYAEKYQEKLFENKNRRSLA
ncbi:MAG: aminodeoxychorismate/anthranilate synthase component II [Saprospiraceae bacterium]|nr:aminodeoxychorismate/anthranilate synthase component II [Saprospiraceae bacterium]